MFDRFFPDQYVASTYVIDFEKLYEEGVRGLIFDIDNTCSIKISRWIMFIMRTSHRPGIISGRWRLWEQTEGVLCLSETSFLQMYGEQNVPESRIFW